MSIAERGFASMDPARQREIASKGGKAAHAKGRAHEWTRDEARQAGRKGGLASHRRGDGATMLPQFGDVLVRNVSATTEYDVSIVPGSPRLVGATHDRAVAVGRDLAEQSRVDAWLTEDRTHFLRIASYRPRAGSTVEESSSEERESQTG
jgi:general stress protein YciG